MKESVRQRLIDIGATQKDIEEIQKRIESKQKKRNGRSYSNEEVMEIIEKLKTLLIIDQIKEEREIYERNLEQVKKYIEDKARREQIKNVDFTGIRISGS